MAIQYVFGAGLELKGGAAFDSIGAKGGLDEGDNNEVIKATQNHSSVGEEVFAELFESEAKQKERAKSIIEMFRSPLFTEDVEEQRETAVLLKKALADARRRGERR